MTTARDVFNITMALLDELGEQNGEAERAENRDYMLRTPAVLTQICGELFAFSDAFGRDDHGSRPSFPIISSLDDELALDDFLCHSVLPCALAARLVIDENPPVSAYYERKFQEALTRYGSARPVTFEPIRDVYGGHDPLGTEDATR